jgi:outer membrane protein OmpA-like peptidoglycan-associated protein
MADVFLSYARADMAKAAQVKAALEGAGLSVFFDVEGLDGGDVFPDVLDREVKAAGAVVSLWSPHALSRPWVKQECSIGLKRKCLIPLAIEPLGDLDVPVAFEGLQQIDFTGFHGRTDSAEWQRLMRSLARTLRRPELVAGTVPAAGGPRGPGDPGERKLHPLWIVSGTLALLLFITAGMLGFMASENDTAPGVEGLPAADASFDAVAADPAINPSTDEASNAVLPIPWVEEEYPGQACGNLKVHVYFEFDKTTPDIASIVALEEALTRGFSCDLSEVRIEGHDDLFNSPAYAQGVSERRASDVASLLIGKGVDGAIISTTGFGSTQPLVPGERTPANRRAVVFLDYEIPLAHPSPATPG